MQSKYDSYSQGGSSGSNDDDDYNNEITLIPNTYTTVRANINRLFGNEQDWGQSIGLGLENVRLLDGTIYVDPEKNKYKLFSWEDVAGLSVMEKLDRGDEPSVDDAPEVETKTYAGNKKTYELVSARVPEITDEDGEVLVEAQSKTRTVAPVNDGDGLDRGEWEDLDGEFVEVGDTITWYGGSQEHGPKAASKSVLQTLSEYGSNAVQDEDDVFNWLPDTSGDNILRDDMQDRTVDFLTVTRDSENGFTYHDPVFEDIKTESRIYPDNREGDDSDEVADAKEADASDRSYPEPVADFISSGRNLNLNEERAESLLDELLADEDNSLTDGMLEESGGRDAVVDEVL